MSDYGLFEASSTDGLEEETRQRHAQADLDGAIFAAREEFGHFLGEAVSREDFDTRLALAKSDLMKCVDRSGVMPVTGVMRRVVKALRPDFSKKRAENFPDDEDPEELDSWTDPNPETGNSNDSVQPGEADNAAGLPTDQLVNDPAPGAGAPAAPLASPAPPSPAPAPEPAPVDPVAEVPAEPAVDDQAAPAEEPADPAAEGLDPEVQQILQELIKHLIPTASLRHAFGVDPTGLDDSSAAAIFQAMEENFTQVSADPEMREYYQALYNELSARGIDPLTASVTKKALGDYDDEPSDEFSGLSSDGPGWEAEPYTPGSNGWEQDMSNSSEMYVNYANGYKYVVRNQDDGQWWGNDTQGNQTGPFNTAEDAMAFTSAFHGAGIDDRPELVPEGDFDGYLKEVSPQSPGAVEKHFLPAEEGIDDHDHADKSNFASRNKKAAAWRQEAPRSPYANALYILEQGDLTAYIDDNGPGDVQWSIESSDGESGGEGYAETVDEAKSEAEQALSEGGEDFYSSRKTADHWKFDTDFQQFLLDNYGTTHGLTDDEIIEAMEGYAGIGQSTQITPEDVAPAPSPDPSPSIDTFTSKKAAYNGWEQSDPGTWNKYYTDDVIGTITQQASDDYSWTIEDDDTGDEIGSGNAYDLDQAISSADSAAPSRTKEGY